MSNDAFEKFIRSTANRLGLDVTRYHPDRSETGRLATMLKHHGVDCVLDVGANTGQFAKALRQAGYAEKIVSFEPLSTAHSELESAAKTDDKWLVAPRAVVGGHQGETEIHIAGNSVSSSALQMLDSHIAAAPLSGFVGSENVSMNTLDRLAADYLQNDSRIFIKVDTQGFEPQVLDGAADLLGRALGVQLELSLVPLYENQVLYEALMDRMFGEGYVVWAFWPALFDPDSGRMLQADATFFRA